jgi:hypothetical protein
MESYLCPGNIGLSQEIGLHLRMCSRDNMKIAPPISCLTCDTDLLRYTRESQPESESAERAAVVPRGGRVLISIQRFIEPHRQTRRWGFCLVKQERHRHNY